MDKLIALYRAKGASASHDGSRHFTFVVIREGKRYFLQKSDGQPPIAVTNVNSIDSPFLLLKSMKQPVERRCCA
jgi:hypothetical protein